MHRNSANAGNNPELRDIVVINSSESFYWERLWKQSEERRLNTAEGVGAADKSYRVI